MQLLPVAWLLCFSSLEFQSAYGDVWACLRYRTETQVFLDTKSGKVYLATCTYTNS